MLQPYRVILTRPGALAFSAAGVLARLPISMVGIGIVLMLTAQYGSYGLAGRVSAVYIITSAACAPKLARLVDSHGQARVMRPATAAAIGGLTALVVCADLGANPAWLYAIAAVAGVPAGSFGSLVRARWSHVLTDPRELHTAYSLESALDEVVFVVGPIAATVLATAVTPSAGLIIPIVALIVGGFLFLSLVGSEPPPLPRAVDAAGKRAHQGSVMRSAGMRVLATVFVAMGAIFGATDVATVAFAEEHGSKGSAGFVLASFALGSMLSGLAYGARNWVAPLWKRFAVGVVTLAAGVSLFFLPTSIPTLALVMFVTGFAIAPTLINGNGLVQFCVPSGRLTEGLTWVGTSLGIGVSIGASLAGMLIDDRGARGGFTVVGVAAGFAVVATLASLRALRAGSTEVGPAVPGETQR